MTGRICGVHDERRSSSSMHPHEIPTSIEDESIVTEFARIHRMVRQKLQYITDGAHHQSLYSFSLTDCNPLTQDAVASELSRFSLYKKPRRSYTHCWQSIVAFVPRRSLAPLPNSVIQESMQNLTGSCADLNDHGLLYFQQNNHARSAPTFDHVLPS